MTQPSSSSALSTRVSDCGRSPSIAADAETEHYRPWLVDDSSVPEDPTSTRIIDAAMAEIASGGVQRLTVEQLARRAGINRTTVYRRFGDLDGVLTAMTMREGGRMAATILGAVDGISEPAEQLVEGFVAAFRVAREHPVIARTATHEPGRLIEAGLADGAALLELGRSPRSRRLRLLRAGLGRMEGFQLSDHVHGRVPAHRGERNVRTVPARLGERHPRRDDPPGAAL
ncbi:TetR/AcrR family transcriptional regulator [Amycolatopsis sp. lyj-112]|uniref:TetR/AcrR family transcriptional regulator n=1 Tax=Amycolatopsis sp. lyj-112 TaxID=2789288 RepID=UPI00397E6F10